MAPTAALFGAESTFQNWPCQFQNDASVELKCPSMSAVEIALSNSIFGADMPLNRSQIEDHMKT